jgi:predicted component of type VI protein secretion system
LTNPAANVKADTTMKVSLVVATGVHQGKVIPIVGPQFVIGRDPECHLRPASQAVSKRHCAIAVRDGQVVLTDFGSTNGCVLNDAVVKGEERPLKNNDSLKVGPLDFTVRVEAVYPREDGTPLPDLHPDTAAAMAAVKAAAVTPTKTVTRDATPNPLAKPKPAGGSKEMPAIKSGGSKEAPALKSDSKSPASKNDSKGVAPAPKAPPAPPTAEMPATGGDEDNDRLAAMLLGMDDADEVPGGSTVVDVPAVGAEGAQAAADAAKAADAKKAPVREDTSVTASDLLRKYMRRPK